MLVNIEKDIFAEIKFYSVQIEITGKCNLRCIHCRGNMLSHHDVTVEEIAKLCSFCEIDRGSNFIISGGEPLLNPFFFDILTYLCKKAPREIVITTNGTLIDNTFVDKIKRISGPKITIQVSLDSINEDTHNQIRGNSHAYQDAIDGIKLLVANKIFSSIRSTVTPVQMQELEMIVQKGIELGVNRVGLSTIVPTGRALELDETLFFKGETKRAFIEEYQKLKNKYHSLIEVVTHEPQKACLENPNYTHQDSNCIYLGGCTAGVAQINMDSNGDITPCALLDIPITNIFQRSIEQAQDDYAKSVLINNLLKKNLQGKCAICRFKDLCGGCRAVPYGLTKNPLGEDITCYL